MDLVSRISARDEALASLNFARTLLVIGERPLHFKLVF